MLIKPLNNSPQVSLPMLTTIVEEVVTFSITRFFTKAPDETIRSGLTLQEARSHCADPETDSRTCTAPDNAAVVELKGAWFDGYKRE